MRCSRPQRAVSSAPPQASGGSTPPTRRLALARCSCTRTLQLLPRQPSVTAVRVNGRGMQTQLHELVGGTAMATQLIAISLKDNRMYGTGGATYRTATYWLQLASLTNSKRLELRGRVLPVQLLPAAAAALVQLRRLTALVLEGGYGENAEAGDALDELSKAFPALTELSQLGLRKFRVADAGMHTLRGTLAGLSRLCALDLSCMARKLMESADRVMACVPACTALTKLELTACRLAAGCDGVRELCGMRVP